MSVDLKEALKLANANLDRTMARVRQLREHAYVLSQMYHEEANGRYGSKTPRCDALFDGILAIREAIGKEEAEAAARAENVNFWRDAIAADEATA